MYNVSIIFKMSREVIHSQKIHEHEITSLVNKAQMFSNQYGQPICILIQPQAHILELVPQRLVASPDMPKQGDYPSVIEFCNTGD